MLTTRDEELAAWVRTARLHGMTSDAWRRYLPGGSWRYSVHEPGLKANLSDVHAAIGRAQLHHLDEWQRRRHQLAGRYGAALAAVEGVDPPLPPDRGEHAWHLYVVRVRPELGISRDDLSTALADRRIGTSVHFIPLHRLPRYRDACLLPSTGLPGADAVFEEILSIPFHQGLTDDEVETVVDTLVDVLPRAHLIKESIP
jgi:dTDP-4-amino-4,6-dideoxygalactose transaminase